MRIYRNIWIISFFIFVFAVSTLILFLEESNKITGNNIVNTRVGVLATQSKNCSFTLYPGWNMVSFYCFGMVVDRSVGLSSLNDSYESIFTYEPTDTSDPWKSYNVNLPSWTVQQLSYMDRISGYWIYINNDSNMINISNNESNFSYYGIYSSSQIPLYSGWNLIGYPKNVPSNINDTLNGIAFSVVRHYNISSNSWMIYVNGGPSNTLTQFNTYDGYWVNVTSNSQLNITIT